MTHWKPVVIMSVAGLIVVLVFLALGRLFTESQNQRKASCDATLIALDSVRETSLAGIRPVEYHIPAGISPSLEKSFVRQRAATVAENARRAAVAVRVEKAAKELQKSHFCDGNSYINFP
jgi:hypothetical protein